MKKIIILLLAFVAITNANAQSAKTPILITPGVGVGPLKLGMSEKKVQAILKGDISWVTYKEEMKSFKDYSVRGFAIDSIPQFILGFDSCAAYMNEAPTKLPVFKLYFNDHKLNFIILTSYGNMEKKNNVAFKNGISFYTDMSECQSKMKNKFLEISCGEYSGDHIYYKDGLEFIYEVNKLRTICVFTPTPNFLQRIADKSYDLQQEYEDVE